MQTDVEESLLNLPLLRYIFLELSNLDVCLQPSPEDFRRSLVLQPYLWSAPTLLMERSNLSQL